MKHSLPMALSALCMLLPSLASAGISQSMKSASSADVYRPQIAAFVQAQVANLVGDDPTLQKTARTILIDQVASNPPPGVSFMDVYADELGKAMEPVANSKTIRARLNLAVVNAEVARRVGNAKQAAITGVFLKDSASPVSMWGVKAAKYELPPQMPLPSVMRSPDLVPAIIASVKAHPTDGLIIAEAYQALTFADTDPSLRSVSNSEIQGLIPALQSLMEHRISLYANAPPPSPTAEEQPILFLTRFKAWMVETPAQQAQTLHLMSGLVTAAGKSLGAADPETRTDLVALIHQIGRAFGVSAGALASDELKKAANDIAEAPSEIQEDELTTRITALDAAIQSALTKPTAPSS